MELADYLAAVRRHWRAALGVLVVSVAVAGLVLVLLPARYTATAKVFVSASASIPSSAQYVEERVKSYPGVVESASVLGPVADEPGISLPVSSLRARVSAVVPANTSEVDVVVVDTDPQRAARIANAVATRTTSVVSGLETAPSGNRLLSLTVSDPATAPADPSSPVRTDVLGLGVLAGLFLGLAAAVVRHRRDTTVHTGDDVRAACGGDGDLPVLAPARGRRARRSALVGSPAVRLARRLEPVPGRALDLVLVAPTAEQEAAARAVAAELAGALSRDGVPATVSGDRARAAGPEAGVRIEVQPATAPARTWAELAARCEGAVLVVPAGRVQADEVREARSLLAAHGLPVLAAVLADRRAAAEADAAQRAADVVAGTGAEARHPDAGGSLPAVPAARAGR